MTSRCTFLDYLLAFTELRTQTFLTRKEQATRDITPTRTA